MVCFFRPDFRKDPRRLFAVILALAVLSGYGCGAVLAIYADNSIVSLVRSAAIADVSTVGLLLTLLFPPILSVCAVYISKIWLFIPIGFLKASAFGYINSITIRAFPDSGWLISVLLAFGSLLSLPALSWFWFRAIFRVQNRLFIPAFCLILFVVAAGMIDILYVSPLLVDLLS